MASNLVIESPDAERIEKESGHFTAGAIQTLWYVLNQEIIARRKQADYVWNDYIPSYAAGDFTCNNGGTWTVDLADLVTFKWALINKIMFVSLRLATTSVTAPVPGNLLIKIPGGYSIGGSRMDNHLARLTDNGVVAEGRITTDPATSTTSMIIKRGDGANFTASVNLTGFEAQTFFEVL